MKHLYLFLILIFSIAPFLSAEKPNNVREIIPNGINPKDDQRALVFRLAAAQKEIRVQYDAEGNVRCFKAQAKKVDGKSLGLLDDDLTDMSKTFSTLKAIRLLHHINLSDNAFSVLEAWPNLEVFCIEHHKGDGKGTFQQYLKSLKKLRWIELKHCPGQVDSVVDTLPHFPDLIRLELDNASAQEKAVPFLKRNPQLVDLEIHRTQMNNHQVKEALVGLKHLKRLHFKQSFGEWQRKKGALLPLTVACLEALKSHKHLEILDIMRWNDSQVFWDGGIAFVADIPSLKRVDFIRSPHKDAKDHPAAVQLYNQRPELHPNKHPKRIQQILQSEYPGLFP